MKNDFTNAALNPGSLLVFTSEMDPYFYGAVVLILKHGAKGTVGVIVNRPDTEHDYKEFVKAEKIDVLKGQGAANRSFLFGGPVGLENAQLTVIHEQKKGVASFTSGDRDARTAAKALEKSNDGVRAAIGFASWTAGGLEKEIAGGAWRVLPQDNDLVFRTKPDDIFPKAAAKAGLHPDLIGYIVNPDTLRKEKGGVMEAMKYADTIRPRPPKP